VVGTLDAGGPLHTELASKGIPTFALGCQARSLYPLGVVRLIQLIKRHGIQVLHTHLVDAGLVGMIAGKLAHVPLVILMRHHADAVLILGKRVAAWADRISAALAHRIIVPAKAVAKILCEVDGVEISKVTVIPLGFDFSLLKSFPGGAERVRGEFSLHGQPVIGVIARLDRLKGHDDFFLALKEIVSQTPNLKVLMVGEGPERTRLEQLGSKLGVRDHLIFTGIRGDIPDLISAMDVVALPSLSEAFPQVIVEALAIGKPVVACQVGGVSEIIKNGETGVLVPPGNPTSLASALCELLRRPEHAKTMGEHGRADVMRRFSISQMCRDYESYYEQWWNGTGPKRSV